MLAGIIGLAWYVPAGPQYLLWAATDSLVWAAGDKLRWA